MCFFFFYLVLGIRGWFDIMGGVRFVFPIPLYSVALLLFLSGGMYYYYYYFYNCLLIYLALEWMAVPHRLADRGDSPQRNKSLSVLVPGDTTATISSSPPNHRTSPADHSPCSLQLP